MRSCISAFFPTHPPTWQRLHLAFRNTFRGSSFIVHLKRVFPRGSDVRFTNSTALFQPCVKDTPARARFANICLSKWLNWPGRINLEKLADPDDWIITFHAVGGLSVSRIKIWFAPCYQHTHNTRLYNLSLVELVHRLGLLTWKRVIKLCNSVLPPLMLITPQAVVWIWL